MSASNNDAAMGQSWAVSAEQDLTDEVTESFIYIKQEFEEEDWEDEAREPLARNNEAADEPPVWSQYPNEVYPRFDNQGVFPIGGDPPFTTVASRLYPPTPPTRRHPSDPEPEAAKVYTMFKCGKSEDGPEYAVRPWSTTIKRHRGAEWQPYCAQDDGPLPEPHTAGRLIEPFNKTLPDLYQKGFNMLFNKRDGGETSLDLLDCSPGASQAFYGWIPKRFMPRRGTIGYWGFDGDCMDRQFQGLSATSSDDKRRKQPRKMASSAGTVFRSPQGNTMRLSVKLRQEKKPGQHQARQTQRPSSHSTPSLPGPSQRPPRVEDEASLRVLDTCFALLNDATLEDNLEQRGLSKEYAAAVDCLRQLRDLCRQDSTELQRTDPNPRPSPTLASAAMPHQRSGPQGTTNVAFRPPAAAAGKNLAEMEREDEEQKSLFARQKARYHAGEEIKLSEACSKMLRYMKRNPPGPRP